MSHQVLVIGAGITGVTAAYCAARRGKKVLLIGDQEPGGAIKSSQIEGFIIEHGAAILVELPELAALIDQIGLRDNVVYPCTRKFAQGIWYNGAPRFLPRSLRSLLGSPLISPWHRLMLPLRVLFGSLRVPTSCDISMAELATPFLGRRGVANMLTPALRAAYGQSADSISARVMLRKSLRAGSRIKCLSMLKARRGRRGFMLRDGNHSLVTKMMQNFQSLGGEFKVAKVCGINRSDRGFIATTESAGSFECQQLVVSSGAQLIDNLAADFDCTVPTPIPLAIVHFALDQNELEHAFKSTSEPVLGVLFPQGEVFGVMFPSQLFDHLAPAGQQLAAVYLGGEDWRTKRIPDREQIVQRAEDGLKLILPGCKPRQLQTTIWERAIPGYPVGAYILDSEFAKLEKNIPNLFAPLRERGGPGVADRVAAAVNLGV